MMNFAQGEDEQISARFAFIISPPFECRVSNGDKILISLYRRAAPPV